MASTDTGLQVPDTTSLDEIVGVPVSGRQDTDVISRRDIRHLVESMGNPNPLHFDANFAAESRFGDIVAPQSAIFGGTVPPEGVIPNSSTLHVESEVWHYGPRFYAGDGYEADRMVIGYEHKNSHSLGPCILQKADTTIATSRGQFLYKRRQRTIRYLLENVAKIGGVDIVPEEPTFTPEDLREIEQKQLDYVDTFIGHEKRLYADVSVGEKLPLKVLGPHSLMSFTWEAAMRLDARTVGSTTENLGLPTNWGGMMDEMMPDPEKVKKNPLLGNAFLFGAGRAHMDPKYSDAIGVGKRGYGFGDSMETWCVDLMSNWAGEWGFVRHSLCNFRRPVVVGDVTYINAEVAEKWINERSGAPTVRIEFEMTNQDGAIQTTGYGEVELPGA